MADDTSTVLKDKPKEAGKPDDKPKGLAPDLLDKKGLDILRGTVTKTAADLHNVELFDSKRNGADPAKADTTKAENVKHEVKKGDTLSHIVEKHLANTMVRAKTITTNVFYAAVTDVAHKNGISNPDKIKPGQVIELPEHAKLAVNQAKLSQAKLSQAKLSQAKSNQAKLNQGTPGDATTAALPGATTDKVTPVVPPAEPVAKPVDVEAMRKKVDVLYGATEGRWGTDEALAKEVLMNSTRAERRLLKVCTKRNTAKILTKCCATK